MGTYVHEDRGGQLAAARGGLAIGPGGVGAHIAKQFFRDEEATHMENITKSVNFACSDQLRLGKDAAADAKALVVKACDGRWGEGEWTTMLTGACVYAASRQNALPITVRDVAEACQLDVFALGRVYNRLKFLHELKVPPLDPATFVARAAAAIPQLRDAMGGGDEDDARGGTERAARRRRPRRSGGEKRRGESGQRGDKPVGRGAKLAPVVEDAKRLLAFAAPAGSDDGPRTVPDGRRRAVRRRRGEGDRVVAGGGGGGRESRAHVDQEIARRAQTGARRLRGVVRVVGGRRRVRRPRSVRVLADVAIAPSGVGQSASAGVGFA